ncbi:imidazole glycerol phosphate synthase subunit HisH [Salibacterium qingdaonense]|uniref:Imidazole glycerol phosphate synthase subunit HisH n=1 Tax=Salibacterium qingdaonense TaxID=266892 RepID=A0A1I4KX83_9BACI|nr:imidazole glycerol phosphate synthase subunit HisH [Salibacterium qingdaonense]SFL83271.1 imidazole glycerol phosphate synthase subunit hisH [Salibacterium qingdaonense]
MIGIIDYGMGNLHSVSKALERLGLPYFLSEDTDELAKADGLILPGVGSFHDAMNLLKEKGQEDFIKKWAADGRPLLGICLGMQLLFDGSEENKHTQGLGFLPGYAKHFPGITEDGTAYKVPHMGWNKLTFKQPQHDLLKDVEEGHVYFVHSYVIQTEDEDVLVADSDYYENVPAVVGRGRVLGTQFHPEKSSTIGMKILENFGRIVAEGGNTYE